jgi:phosphoglycerate dehydrogenase-like enzyme
MKIVFLQGKDQIDKVFTERHLQQLRKHGDVVLNEIGGAPSPNDIRDQIKGADIAITSWGCKPLTSDILDQAPNLRLVLHAAGTVKGVVTPELYNRGIRVTGGAAALGKGVAETALGMTITSLKDMWTLSRQSREGLWGHVSRVRELYEVKIGVIGSGRAGSHYIKLLQAFDVEVLVYDPFLTDERAAVMGARKVALEELLTEADVISVHAPSLPETYKMLNRERFEQMKDDCILINTARGSIIDEEALVAELRKGRFFACLDVTAPEPPAIDHPFRSLPNVILTSHIAGSVNNGLHRLAQYIVDELEAFLKGEPMDGEVRKEQLEVFA